MRQLVISTLNELVTNMNEEWEWSGQEPIVLTDLHVTNDEDLLKLLLHYHAQACQAH
jgi:hypothetical protein